MPTWAPYLGHEIASFFGSCLFNSSSPNKNWKLTATRVALFGETNSPKNKRSNAKHIKCLGQLKYAGLTERRCSLSLSPTHSSYRAQICWGRCCSFPGARIRNGRNARVTSICEPETLTVNQHPRPLLLQHKPFQDFQLGRKNHFSMFPCSPKCQQRHSCSHQLLTHWVPKVQSR